MLVRSKPVISKTPVDPRDSPVILSPSESMKVSDFLDTASVFSKAHDTPTVHAISMQFRCNQTISRLKNMNHS